MQSKQAFRIADINASTFLGKAIVDNWAISPAECIRTARDMYRDNPDTVRGVIGDYNAKLIVKQIKKSK
jgi:hypothetical protein